MRRVRGGIPGRWDIYTADDKLLGVHLEPRVARRTIAELAPSMPPHDWSFEAWSRRRNMEVL